MLFFRGGKRTHGRVGLLAGWLAGWLENGNWENGKMEKWKMPW